MLPDQGGGGGGGGLLKRPWGPGSHSPATGLRNRERERRAEAPKVRDAHRTGHSKIGHRERE